MRDQNNILPQNVQDQQNLISLLQMQARLASEMAEGAKVETMVQRSEQATQEASQIQAQSVLDEAKPLLSRLAELLP